MASDLGTAAIAHPGVDVAGVIDHAAHGRVVAEHPIRQPKPVEGVPEVSHAAYQVRSAAPDDDEQRPPALGVEIVPQGIGHGSEGGVDVRVAGLAADDEQHVALREPVL